MSDDDNGNLDDEGSIENTIDALPRENIAGSSTVKLGSELDKGDKFTTETTTVTSSKPVTTEKEKPMTISTTEVSSIPVDLVLNRGTSSSSIQFEIPSTEKKVTANNAKSDGTTPFTTTESSRNVKSSTTSLDPKLSTSTEPITRTTKSPATIPTSPVKAVDNDAITNQERPPVDKNVIQSDKNEPFDEVSKPVPTKGIVDRFGSENYTDVPLLDFSDLDDYYSDYYDEKKPTDNISEVKPETKPPSLTDNIIEKTEISTNTPDGDPISTSISSSTSSVSGTVSMSSSTQKLPQTTESAVTLSTSTLRPEIPEEGHEVPDHEIPHFINDHAHGPPTTEDEEEEPAEPISIATIISKTVDDYVEGGNLEEPCELVVRIETQPDLVNPEIQVEPAIIDANDSLRATVKLPGEPENAVEFKVTVPKSADGKSIDVQGLAEIISKTFDDILSGQATTFAPLSTKIPVTTQSSASSFDYEEDFAIDKFNENKDGDTQISKLPEFVDPTTEMSTVSTQKSNIFDEDDNDNEIFDDDSKKQDTNDLPIDNDPLTNDQAITPDPSVKTNEEALLTNPDRNTQKPMIQIVIEDSPEEDQPSTESPIIVSSATPIISTQEPITTMIAVTQESQAEDNEIMDDKAAIIPSSTQPVDGKQTSSGRIPVIPSSVRPVTDSTVIPMSLIPVTDSPVIPTSVRPVTDSPLIPTSVRPVTDSTTISPYNEPEYEDENEILPKDDDSSDPIIEESDIPFPQSNEQSTTRAPVKYETTTRVTTTVEVPFEFEDDIDQIPPQSREDGPINLITEKQVTQTSIVSTTKSTTTIPDEIDTTTLTVSSSTSVPKEYEEYDDNEIPDMPGVDNLPVNVFEKPTVPPLPVTPSTIKPNVDVTPINLSPEGRLPVENGIEVNNEKQNISEKPTVPPLPVTTSTIKPNVDVTPINLSPEGGLPVENENEENNEIPIQDEKQNISEKPTLPLLTEDSSEKSQVITQSPVTQTSTIKTDDELSMEIPIQSGEDDQIDPSKTSSSTQTPLQSTVKNILDNVGTTTENPTISSSILDSANEDDPFIIGVDKSKNPTQPITPSPVDTTDKPGISLMNEISDDLMLIDKDSVKEDLDNNVKATDSTALIKDQDTNSIIPSLMEDSSTKIRDTLPVISETTNIEIPGFTIPTQISQISVSSSKIEIPGFIRPTQESQMTTLSSIELPGFTIPTKESQYETTSSNIEIPGFTVPSQKSQMTMMSSSTQGSDDELFTATMPVAPSVITFPGVKSALPIQPTKSSVLPSAITATSSGHSSMESDTIKFPNQSGDTILSGNDFKKEEIPVQPTPASIQDDQSEIPENSMSIVLSTTEKTSGTEPENEVNINEVPPQPRQDDQPNIKFDEPEVPVQSNWIEPTTPSRKPTIFIDKKDSTTITFPSVLSDELVPSKTISDKPNEISATNVPTATMSSLLNTESDLSFETENVPAITSSFKPVTEREPMTTTPILDFSTQETKDTIKSTTKTYKNPSIAVTFPSDISDELKGTPSNVIDIESLVDPEENISSKISSTASIINLPIKTQTTNEKKPSTISNVLDTTDREPMSKMPTIRPPIGITSDQIEEDIKEKTTITERPPIAITNPAEKKPSTISNVLDTIDKEPMSKMPTVRPPIGITNDQIEEDIKEKTTITERPSSAITTPADLPLSGVMDGSATPPSVTEKAPENLETPTIYSQEISSTEELTNVESDLEDDISKIPPQSREDVVPEVSLPFTPIDSGEEKNNVFATETKSSTAPSVVTSTEKENVNTPFSTTEINGEETSQITPIIFPRISTTSNSISTSTEMPIKPIAISYQICEEIYIFCDLPSITCQKRYDECKSDSKLDTEPEKGQLNDDLLINGISRCNTSFSRCQGENCISQVRNCLLKTLEDARQRRLRSETALEEKETPSRPVEVLDLDIKALDLSNNFTDCVTEYSACLDYRGDQTYCKQKFNNCSLDILSDTELSDEQALKQPPFVYDPTKNEGLEQDEHELSADLFICIQEFMMCNMNRNMNCMRNYNFCTLKVLDNYHNDKGNLLKGIVINQIATRSVAQRTLSPLDNKF